MLFQRNIFSTRSRVRLVRSLTCWILLFAALLLQGCGGGKKNDSPRIRLTQSELTSLISRTRQKYNLPGLTAALVASDGQPVVAAVGARRSDQPENRLSTTDRFVIGSCGKAMTATLIGLLVADGKLSYSQTLAGIFPELASRMNSAYRDLPLSRVLECRAGFMGFESEEELALLPPLSGSLSEQRAQFSEWLLQQPPVVAPGTFLYSNASYVLLASVVERVTGRAWEMAIQERVYQPLGMQNVGYTPPALEQRQTQPWGHYLDTDQATPLPPDQDWGLLVPFAAPAGLHTMAMAEWAKFARFHLRGLRNRSGDLALTPAAVRAMHQEVGEGEVSQGGWSTITLNGKRVSNFIGGTGSFYSIIVILPEQDAAILLVTNSSGENSGDTRADRAFQEILQTLASGRK